MKNNIQELQNNINACRNFIEKYGSAFKPEYIDGYEPMLSVDSKFLCLDKSYAAEAGKVFGTSGWTRHAEYGGRGEYSWRKTVDGVQVHIPGAECVPMDNTPVPPNAFPIQLEDVK